MQANNISQRTLFYEVPFLFHSLLFVFLSTRRSVVIYLQSNKSLNLLMYLSISQDIYKVLDDVLGQGAHTTVKSCVKLTTNQEYAVKVRKLSCGDRLLPPDFPFKLSSVMLLWKISILLP